MTKENKPLKSILFVSRNKDNKHIPNFKERRYVRLTTKTAEELKKDFDHWVAKGPEGEFCRFYMKINRRDPIKTKKKLIEELIFNDNFDLVAAEAKIAGIANKKNVQLNVNGYLILMILKKNLKSSSMILKNMIRLLFR